MNLVSRYDLRQVGKAFKNDAGFLKVPVSATRIGVFKYTKSDGSVFRELRLPEEVFNKESMDSLKGVPFTKRHPTEMVNAKNAKRYMVGFTSDTVEHDNELLKTSVTVTDQEMINLIENETMREVSCGYTCEMEMTPGTWKGEVYDAIQRNIRYNHLAAVEKGRAGPKVRLHMDSEGALYNDSDLEIIFEEADLRKKGSINEDDLEDDDLEDEEIEDDEDDLEEEEVEDGGPGSGPSGGGGGSSQASRQAKLTKNAKSAAKFSKRSKAIKGGLQSKASNKAAHASIMQTKASKKLAKDSLNSHSTGGTMAKIQLGGAEYEVDGGLATAIGTALKEKETKARADADKESQIKIDSAAAEAKKTVDASQAKIDELTEANKKLEASKMDTAEINKLVVARVALIEKAKPIVKADTKFDEMDEMAIKKSVIAAKYPDLKLDEKSADYVSARFDAIIDAEPVKKSTDGLKKVIVGKVDGEEQETPKTADEVRQAKMKADSEAWKQPIGKSKK